MTHNSQLFGIDLSSDSFLVSRVRYCRVKANKLLVGIGIGGGTLMMVEEEEDYGALIYRESQLRKAEAAAAAAAARVAKKKKDSSAAASSTTLSRAISTAVRGKAAVNITLRTETSRRKRESSTEDDEVARKRTKWREDSQK